MTTEQLLGYHQRCWESINAAFKTAAKRHPERESAYLEGCRRKELGPIIERMREATKAAEGHPEKKGEFLAALKAYHDYFVGWFQGVDTNWGAQRGMF